MRFILLALPTAYGLSASALPRRSNSKFCLTHEPCFPSQAVLAEFNQTIGGKLHSQRPINAVCYADDPSFSEAACSELTEYTYNSTWRIEHFPAYQFTDSEFCGPTNSCNSTTLVSNQTCHQGRVPDYAVYAESSQDVVEYVRFATKHNLRIVIKNTGHDMLRRSSGKGGFAVWTHKMKGLEFHEHFVPEACHTVVDGGALTLSAGVQWAEAYKFADEVGRHIVGGASTSVGSAGGYLLGGGHSFLSPSLGLSVDNLVEMELVTPDGELRTISACSHPDLFWAVRGGGGGTWGVTTKVTYRTHPRTEIHTLSLGVLRANVSDGVFTESLTRWVKLAPALGDLGLGGATVLMGDSLGIVGVIQASHSNLTQLQKVAQPFISWLAEQGVAQADLKHLADGTSIYMTYSSWYHFYIQALATGAAPAGRPGGSGTRLIPRHYYESDPAGLAKILLQANSTITIGMAGPSRFAQEHPDAANHTSVNPVWYNSLWHVMSSAVVEPLREYAKDGAVYFGESDINEPNAADAYWGTNYPALLDIKRKWDPLNAFQVWHGVGSPTLANRTESECA